METKRKLEPRLVKQSQIENSQKGSGTERPDARNTLTPAEHPILQLLGQRIVVHQRSSLSVIGTLTRYKGGLLRLSDAQITGSDQRIEWVLVERTLVSLIMPATEETTSAAMPAAGEMA